MTKKKKKHYVDNQKLYDALCDYHKERMETEPGVIPKPSDYIGLAIMDIAKNVSLKPNFINYPYREEMIADGIENIIRYGLKNWSPERDNPFAYFTQIVHNAFLRRIELEKKYLYTKHKVTEQKSIHGEFSQSSDHGEKASEHYGEASTDYMDDFVRSFERSLKRKNERARKRKTLFDGE